MYIWTLSFKRLNCLHFSTLSLYWDGPNELFHRHFANLWLSFYPRVIHARFQKLCTVLPPSQVDLITKNWCWFKIGRKLIAGKERLTTCKDFLKGLSLQRWFGKAQIPSLLRCRESDLLRVSRILSLGQFQIKIHFVDTCPLLQM